MTTIDVRDFDIKPPSGIVYSRPACFTCRKTDVISNYVYHVCFTNKDSFDEWFYKLADFPNVTSICIHRPLRESLQNLLKFPVSQFTHIDLASLNLTERLVGFVVELCKKYKLKRLLLQSNSLGAGTSLICNYLATVKEETLQVLDLEGNYFEDVDSWNSILLLTKNTRTLRKLTISYNRNNRITGFEDFVEILVTNKSLLNVSAMGCFIMPFLQKNTAIVRLFKENLRIQHLTLHRDETGFFQDKFCTRNREVFAPESVYNSLLNIGLALFPRAKFILEKSSLIAVQSKMLNA